MKDAAAARDPSGDLDGPARGPAHPAGLSHIIATAPRTGSSLLAEALTATRRAGNPDEFFDVYPENEAYWARRFAVPEDEHYIDHIVDSSRTENGVFGVKLHWHQMPAFRARLIKGRPAAGLENRPAFALLQGRFPGIRFIWLSRRNKIAQAISYYRAANSGVWRVWDDDRSQPSVPAARIDYDYEGIKRYVAQIQEMDMGWRQFFMENKVPALMVIYENFVQSYERTIRGVMSFLGLRPEGIPVAPPNLVRMADAESLEWERRFRLEQNPAQAPLTAVAIPAAKPVAKPKVPAPANKRRTAPARSARPAEPRLPLIAYDVGSALGTTLVAGGPSRAWMDATPKRFAYRCLPMIIANQSGWLIETQHRVEAIWDGSDAISGLKVTSSNGHPTPAAVSHFVSGTDSLCAFSNRGKTPGGD